MSSQKSCIFAKFSATPEEMALHGILQHHLPFLTEEELLRLVIVKKTIDGCVAAAQQYRETIVKYTPQGIRIDDIASVLSTRFMWAWQGARAKDGSSVLCCSAKGLQRLVATTHPQQVLRAMFFVVEGLYRIDPEGLTRHGITVIADMADVSPGMCLGTRAFLQSVIGPLERGAWPVKVKRVLLFHVSRAVRLSLQSLFLSNLVHSEKVKGRVKIIRYAELSREIDRHMIPLEYGGLLDDVCYEKWIQMTLGSQFSATDSGWDAASSLSSLPTSPRPSEAVSMEAAVFLDEEERELYSRARATKEM